VEDDGRDRMRRADVGGDALEGHACAFGGERVRRVSVGGGKDAQRREGSWNARMSQTTGWMRSAVPLSRAAACGAEGCAQNASTRNRARPSLRADIGRPAIFTSAPDSRVEACRSSCGTCPCHHRGSGGSRYGRARRTSLAAADGTMR
jgi:hypothetical protein